MPIPVRTDAGQPETEPVGLGAGGAEDHHAGGEDERARDDHRAVAEAVGKAPGGPGDDGRGRRSRQGGKLRR